MFIDSHSHFDICMEKDFSEEDLISGLKQNNIEAAVQVATHPGNFQFCADFAAKYNNIYYTLGIHPSDPCTDDDINMLDAFVNEKSNDSKLIAIGEIGLDYHWMESEKEIQQKYFKKQIEIAQKNDLYIVVHSRDAMPDTIRILDEMDVKKAVIHCYSGTAEEAKYLISKGYFISFAGNVTYKNAKNIQEAALSVPVEKMLLETDCPFLSPVPMRGKKNRPDYVKYTYEFISILKNISVENLSKHIRDNFKKIVAG